MAMPAHPPTPPDTAEPPSWRLEPMMGPTIAAIALTGDGPLRLGRALDSDIRLPESERTVSRTHARFRFAGGVWYITDLDSTHGTFLNGERLPGQQERPLTRGDRLRVGPWTFRVSDGSAANHAATIIDEMGAGERLVAVDARKTQIARRRLELLLDAAKKIAAAEDEAQLAEVVLRMLQEGTGYSMAALVRPGALMTPASPIDLVGVKMQGRAGGASAGIGGVVISRQLVHAACQGQMVSLSRDVGSTASSMHTLADAGVRNAMCVPILQEGKVALCLYLDSLHSERAPEDDAAGFCQGVAELCALALSNMQRSRLSATVAADAKEKQAALDIQKGILPPSPGKMGPVEYAVSVLPGKQVSGDLFDIVQLDDGRIGFFVGDVTGKGVPAAILAATTQSYVAAALRHYGCPGVAVNAANKHLCARTAGGKFVTLWCAVLDPRTGRMQCVDAGHGFALLVAPGEEAQKIFAGDGLPLRVTEDEYTLTEVQVPRGARVVLYSDGVYEQPSAAAAAAGRRTEQFGDRIIGTLATSTQPQKDVESVIEAVLRFSGLKRGEPLADDLTVASMLLAG